MSFRMSLSMVVALLLQAGLACAQPLPVNERPTVAVQGDAEILVEPDHAVLRIVALHTGDALVPTRDSNRKTVEALIADARKLGIPVRDVASTPSMAFPGRWHCESCNDDYRRAGYTARSSVTLTLRNMERLADFVEMTGKDASLQLEDVEYRTTALREHRDSARAAAMRAAREKATALAGEIGQPIGKALTIVEVDNGGGGFWSWSQWGYSCCGYHSSRGGMNGGMSQNVSMAASGGSLEDVGALAPGRIAVRASVRVSFELL